MSPDRRRRCGFRFSWALALAAAATVPALGFAYRSGRGVEENDAKSLEWFRRAAALGHAASMHEVGSAYDNAWGIAEDPNQALKWYLRAARAGDGEGACRLCSMYANGYNVEVDFAQALPWCRKAARQDLCVAELGNLYALGQGTPKNEVEAVRLFRKAAQSGDVRAALSLAKMLEMGRGVEADPVEAYRWYWMISRGEEPRDGQEAVPPEVGDFYKADRAAAGREVERLNGILKPGQIKEALRRAAASRMPKPREPGAP